ncbi:FecR family protein [Paraflavitalea sp. CAU 1676]|uniref:FecR family protein n=1 Tax=Paraflavitalea sp. CAU 1676 TaxID=3032598 RepID=UPI0023DBA618|nr:FecR family protein [Paraflavitalea sp. CAU 1676]MDF2192599.1 FecR domain-containing protein [Paraflavitalea sp. CAU 1676]
MYIINHYRINNNIMQETAVNRIVALLASQQKGTITVEDQQELDSWATASEANKRFMIRCGNKELAAEALNQLDNIDEDSAWQRFLEKNDLAAAPVVTMRRKPWRWLVAAVLAGAIAVGAFMFWPRNNKPAKEPAVLVNKTEDVQPGGNKATLTLGDGRTITLNDARDGVLNKEEGAAVNKEGDALVYDAGKGNAPKEKGPLLYHVLTTPIGGTYYVSLPDKSKVWLNADSRIKYPTVFSGRERRVEVLGEAYFEVAKDLSKPFVVKTGELDVEVLGTHFNVRNYSDESAVKTTLIEGKVQVGASDKDPVVLTPGEQASMDAASGRGARVAAVDVEAVMAWKNGYFEFRAATLSEVMKEIRRWYVGIKEIVFEEPVNDKFTATIPRNVNLRTLLLVLEETERVHFEIEDNKIIISR